MLVALANVTLCPAFAEEAAPPASNAAKSVDLSPPPVTTPPTQQPSITDSPRWHRNAVIVFVTAAAAVLGGALALALTRNGDSPTATTLHTHNGTQ
jgi:hypothetical protein